MTAATTRTLRPRRGYLLVEALIAGVVVAVTLFAAMDLITDARVLASDAGARQTAAALARAKADEIVSSLPTGVADGAMQNVPGVPNMRWTWTTTVDAAMAAASTPALTAGTVRRVSVTVEYPADHTNRTLTVVQTWVQ